MHDLERLRAVARRDGPPPQALPARAAAAMRHVRPVTADGLDPQRLAAVAARLTDQVANRQEGRNE